MAYDTLFKESGIQETLYHPYLEADDCIAIFAKKIKEINKNTIVTIITADHDYLQLLNNDINIYTLKHKPLRTEKNSSGNAECDLFCKIILGDKSDNIPRVFDRCGEKGALALWNDKNSLETKLETENKKEVFDRNKKIIDFNEIPEHFKIEFLNSIKDILVNYTMKPVKIQKPFIKWLGGKTNIIQHIIKRIPIKMKNYHELFLGGGSVLLAVLSLHKNNKIEIKDKIYAYDINKTLIHVYKHLQKNCDILFDTIRYYFDEYDSIDGTEINRKPVSHDEALTSKESYYYWIRKQFNNEDKKTLEAAALFVFLNKTCFRGVYREGPNGFNVPYGHYKTTPKFISKEEFTYVSELIKNVVFVIYDFSKAIKKVKKGDFIYLDPPYAPKNATSFVGYTKDGFTLDKHKLLFDHVEELNKKNIKFAMSNANVPLVVDYFKDYNMDTIVAKRAIHSKNPGETAKEVIIYN